MDTSEISAGDEVIVKEPTGPLTENLLICSPFVVGDRLTVSDTSPLYVYFEGCKDGIPARLLKPVSKATPQAYCTLEIRPL